MERNHWIYLEAGDSHKHCILLLRKFKVAAQMQLLFHQVLDVHSPLLWEYDLSDLTDFHLDVNVVRV